MENQAAEINMNRLLGIKFVELPLILGILLGSCFITYSNALHNAFMWDDGPTFSDIKLNNIKYLPNAFFYPTAHSDKSDSFVNSDFYYRPMAYVITLLSYLAIGDHPLGYHVFNLFLFTFMCFTVYILIDLFFKDKILAFITSLLFAVHPINVFFVDYITSGIHSLRFICMMWSLILFLKTSKGLHQYFTYSASLLCFIVALLCHETSFVLPFYSIFAIYFYKKASFKEAVFKSWPFWSILFIYLLFRFLCTHLRTTLPAVHINPLFYIATFSKIIFLYVSKLFLPQDVVFFWNSPWMTGLNALIWMSGLLTLLGGWWLLARAKIKTVNFFCASWLLIGFIPVFLAAFPPYDKIYYGLIIEPQWVTFASVGFFLFIASIGLKLFTRWKKITALAFIALLFVLIINSKRCNEIWGDEYNYYFYWSQQIHPLPAVNYAYLANIYALKEEYGQARYYYEKSLEKKPDPIVFANLGLIDMKLGDINEAKKNFLLAVKFDPHFSTAYNNLGVIYFNQGDYNAAKEAFLQTIKLNKYCIEARSNLGLIALLQGAYREAANYYQGNLDIIPYEEASLLGIVQAYAILNDPDDMNKYARILMIHGKDPDTLARLKKILRSHPH